MRKANRETCGLGTPLRSIMLLSWVVIDGWMPLPLR